jgi:uncharacterized membrane protein HdeD (DUF308 family)
MLNAHRLDNSIDLVCPDPRIQNMNTSLLQLLAKNWWMFLLKGLAGVIFGLIAFARPGITLFTLVLLCGAYIGVVGVLEVIAAIRGGTMAPRWWLAVAGFVAIAASAMTFLTPGITALLLIYIVGVWALVHGICEIIGAIQVRKLITNEWGLILSGLLSALFGIAVLLRPGAGAVGLVWMIGAYAIAVGILLIGLSLRLRKHVATVAA